MYLLNMQKQLSLSFFMFLSFWEYTDLNFLFFRLEDGSAAVDMLGKSKDNIKQLIELVFWAWCYPVFVLEGCVTIQGIA